MKPYIIILLVITGSIVFLLAQNRDSSLDTDYTTYQNLAKLMEEKVQGSDFFLVDVRTPGEYKAGHIPSALLIPLDIIAAMPPTEDRNAIIILYCRTGSRSGQAQRILEDMGYTQVHNFGGYQNWKGNFAYGAEP